MQKLPTHVAVFEFLPLIDYVGYYLGRSWGLGVGLIGLVGHRKNSKKFIPIKELAQAPVVLFFVV